MFHNLIKSLKSNLPIIFLCVALQILLGVAISRTYLLFHNTIDNNGSWVSTKMNLDSWAPTKMNLEKGVMGAASFFYGRQALAKGHLNLGAWHGFQEVLYKDKLHVNGFEFDFWLDPKAYLNIVLNKSDRDFSCIRLSVSKYFESAYLVVSDLGGFLKKVTIDTPTLRARHWHNTKLHFDADTVTLLLDDKEIARFNEHILHKRRIGFRGGNHKTLVDNVFIDQHKAKSLYESFSNGENVFCITALFLILVGICNGLIFIPLWFASRKYAGFYLVMFNIVLIVISASSFIYTYRTAEYYPKKDAKRKQNEEYYKRSEAERIAKDIRNKYGEMPNNNLYRILFIGTSQTWGSGASKQSRTFVNKIEKKLNECGIQKFQIECINTGVRGSNSVELLKLYEGEWLKLKPKMVVINLAYNDGDIDMYASNLQHMIKISVRAGIQPVFVLEANSMGPVDKHEVMRRIGIAHNVPIVDMHAYLTKKYDEGFLWWDEIHLTDFGQDLVAEKLYNELVQVMKNRL